MPFPWFEDIVVRVLPSVDSTCYTTITSTYQWGSETRAVDILAMAFVREHPHEVCTGIGSARSRAAGVCGKKEANDGYRGTVTRLSLELYLARSIPAPDADWHAVLIAR